MTTLKKNYYVVGGFEVPCSANNMGSGHNQDNCRVQWTGTMGFQKVGNLVCVCGASVRVIEYAASAKARSKRGF